MTSSPYDLILRGGHVVDPAHGVDRTLDVAVEGGRIAAVGEELPGPAREVLDVSGRFVLPGLVDLHVHLSGDAGGAAGHAMLARAGVTTALDLSGPLADVLAVAARHGAGLTIGVVDALSADRHVPRRPSRAQVRDALHRIRVEGGLGVKLLVDEGWDPGTTALAVEEANDLGIWVASHCGTTTAGSDLDGLRQTLDLAGPARLHVAHVNSYCRGDLDAPEEEARQALELLRARPHVFAESYLAAINATWGECVGRDTVSIRLRGWLSRAGFTPDADGVRDAILRGFAAVTHPGADDVRLLTGEEGVARWRAAGTRTSLCLPVNPAESRVLLATARTGGRFDVQALATDGGGLPRNTTLRAGLALVDLGFLTLAELVTKASLTPARVLGTPGKGHLGVGADADIAVLDATTRAVPLTVARGRVVQRDGVVTGRGTHLLTTPEGTGAVRVGGGSVLDPRASGLYTGEGFTE